MPSNSVTVPSQGRSKLIVHEGLGGARLIETLALNGSVDDLLGQVERQEIGNHRDCDDQQDPELLTARMGPDIAGETFFHGRVQLTE